MASRALTASAPGSAGRRASRQTRAAPVRPPGRRTALAAPPRRARAGRAPRPCPRAGRPPRPRRSVDAGRPSRTGSARRRESPPRDATPSSPGERIDGLVRAHELVDDQDALVLVGAHDVAVRRERTPDLGESSTGRASPRLVGAVANDPEGAGFTSPEQPAGKRDGEDPGVHRQPYQRPDE